MSRRFLLLLLLLLPLPALAGAAGATTRPVDVTPARVALAAAGWGGGLAPEKGYAPLRFSGPATARPGGPAAYRVEIANYDAVTRTMQLSVTLPAGLALLPGSHAGLAWDGTTRTLSWSGAVGPGRLDYIVEDIGAALPYIDLADLGLDPLCSGDCDEARLTFNLGAAGYEALLYGRPLTRLTVTDNGLLAGLPALLPAADGANGWLPGAPGLRIAGLWRDVDPAPGGRWHAAIVGGLLAGHDVFYAQWHDLAGRGDAGLTARHAVAVVLGRQGEAPPPLAGTLFYIYDNVADPAGTAAAGYTIGIGDADGTRGTTHAFAPCCGGDGPPLGQPPAPGTTLRLTPVVFGPDDGHRRSFSFTAAVDAPVPATVATTARLQGAETGPAWATHYLAVRHQLLLPALPGGGQ